MSDRPDVVLDVMAPHSEGKGQIINVSIKADAKEGRNRLYKVKARFKVENPGAAQIVERVIPGAKSRYDEAQNENSARKHRGTETLSDCSVVLSIALETGKVALKEVTAKVTSVQLLSSRKRCEIVAEFLFNGDEATASPLIAALGQDVDVLTDRLQNVLPFPKKAEVKPGQLVYASIEDGEEVVGIVQEIQDEGEDGRVAIIQDLNGADGENEVMVDQIQSATDIDRDHPEFKQLVQHYVDRLAEQGVTASWASILAALAENPQDGIVVLTTEVISHAIALATGQGRVAQVN